MKPATTPSPAARPGVLAPERHVVYAAQDAAVCRLGEQDLLLLQIAERPRWLGRAVPYASNGIPGRRIGDGAGDDRVGKVLQRLESMVEALGKGLGELECRCTGSCPSRRGREISVGSGQIGSPMLTST